MSKRYLVTGGTGFIGSSLVKKLVASGYRVRVLDNNARGRLSRLSEVQDQIEVAEADIRDAAAVADATRGMDGVIHAAFINGTEFFYTMPELVLDVGVRGMLNVLDACIKHDIPELIVASSSEVYQTPPTVPTDETAPLSIPDPMNPRYSYGAGKIISEILSINYARKHFKRMVIFRPHNVFGPDMGWEHVIPQFVLRMKSLAAKHKGAIPFPIQGSGEETRAFIYIDDFTDGLMHVIERGEHMNIYHIGTMEELKIADVARAVGECFGRQVEIQPGQLAAGGTMRRCPDIARLRSLGFEPSVPFKVGLLHTVKWYDEHAHDAPVKS